MFPIRACTSPYNYKPTSMWCRPVILQVMHLRRSVPVLPGSGDSLVILRGALQMHRERRESCWLMAMDTALMKSKQPSESWSFRANRCELPSSLPRVSKRGGVGSSCRKDPTSPSNQWSVPRAPKEKPLTAPLRLECVSCRDHKLRPTLP